MKTSAEVWRIAPVLWLCFTSYGCSHGPSGGKRLASEKALEAIKNTYENRSNRFLFRSSLPTTKGSIAMAERAGDRSRKADVQLDIDLDSCDGALAAYEMSLQPDTYIPKDQMEALQSALPRCIQDLQKDLAQ